ncbi:hypothetical protein BT96DRAFT_987021 [Gymnopus androsaceus JB14]|uniref:Uncharacterized protein n=1 Tax=Gymnopus androsaceus JB14 TaxID=1447944 RepID=A0A6A4I550_9AGAR|nr:hypothetical protein BT96DRAFT_987021 [Gymnopus androsaceus JB14]
MRLNFTALKLKSHLDFHAHAHGYAVNSRLLKLPSIMPAVRRNHVRRGSEEAAAALPPITQPQVNENVEVGAAGADVRLLILVFIVLVIFHYYNYQSMDKIITLVETAAATARK